MLLLRNKGSRETPIPQAVEFDWWIPGAQNEIFVKNTSKQWHSFSMHFDKNIFEPKMDFCVVVVRLFLAFRDVIDGKLNFAGQFFSSTKFIEEQFVIALRPSHRGVPEQ